MDTTFELVKLSRHVVGMQKELGQEQNITEQFFVEVVPSVGTPYIAGPMEEWVADKLIARLEAQEIAEEMELNFQKRLKIEIFNRIQTERELAIKEGREPKTSVSFPM